MEDREHSYQVNVGWTGNLGSGTSDYRAYDRAHEVTAGAKPVLLGSADRAFRGDRERWNPEELLVVSVSQCHMLWYLDLAARSGVVVTDYVDHATGRMVEHPDGGGEFVEVTLRPTVTITAGSSPESAHGLHDEVQAVCFIARSVNFPIHAEPVTVVED